MRSGPGGYEAGMADVRENHAVPDRDGEEFHEETPQEFAAQPDREFTKVRPPGAEPDDTEADTAQKKADRAATDED